MKAETQTRKVATSTTQAKDFSIKANGKAFRILIDGLYENKIQSIVREIWSNALDSHVEAGCPQRPFSITFPSMYNPVFTVRDYGTSLDHEDIMGLYSTVFESTKEDTNEAIGKWGLGSKSPFAYTDTFSVTAVMDGQKRFYTALIAEDGVPQIHFMGETETTEERGIEVSFPIATRDIEAFRTAALRVSHGFDVKPDVLRVDEDEPEFSGWPDLPILSEGKGWKLLQGAVEGYSRRAYARMGCVLYPINTDAISGLNEEEKRLLHSTLIIDFPVGALEISASREALSYGPKDPTEESIRNRIRTIVQEMVQAFTEQYNKADSFWDACQLFRLHTEDNNVPGVVRTFLRKNAEYDGRRLCSHIEIGRYKSSNITVPQKGFHVDVIADNRLTNVTYRFNHSGQERTIRARKGTVVFIEDLDQDAKVKRIPSRLKAMWQEEAFNTLVWIKYSTNRESITTMIRFMEYFDGADIRTVADLPEVPAAKRGEGIRRPLQVRQWQWGRYFENRVDLSPDQMKNGGYYVPFERMQPQLPSGCDGPEALWKALHTVGAIDQSKEVLYGVPKSLWKRFESEQWVNIYDYAEEYFKTHKSEKKIAAAQALKDIISNEKLRFVSKYLNIPTLMDNSIIPEALKMYEDAATAKKPAVEGITILGRTLGKDGLIDSWKKNGHPELEQLEKKLDDRYPLLMTFNIWSMQRAVDNVHHYVLVCDKAAKYDDSHNPPTTATKVA